MIQYTNHPPQINLDTTIINSTDINSTNDNSIASISLSLIPVENSSSVNEAAKNSLSLVPVDNSFTFASSPSFLKRLSTRLAPNFTIVGWQSSPKVEPISIQTKLISYLTAEGKTNPKEALENLFGKRLVEQVLSRYNFQEKENLSVEELQIVLMGISVHVTIDDLKDFHQKLSLKEDNLFGEVINEHELKTMQEIASHDFDSLNDSQLKSLLSFFREERLLDGKNQALPVNEERTNRFKTLVETPRAQDLLTKDLYLLENINDWNRFRNDENPELAVAEFLGRYLSYGALLHGMVLAYPQRNTDEPTFYKVIERIDEVGFACFLLKGISPEQRHNIMVLGRGTDVGDKASLVNNLGQVSGHIAYKNYKNSINSWIERAYENAETNVNIDFVGFSQGGAIVQLAAARFISKLAKKVKKNPSFKPPINNINLFTWNSPAILEKHAKSFANSLELFESDSRTNHLFFEINYSRVDWDLIQKFGETFIGFNRKTDNVSCSVFYYPTVSYAPIVGPHSSSNLLAIRAHLKPSRKYIDRRQGIFERRKQIAYLEWYIFSSRFDAQLLKFTNNLGNKDKELVNTLKEMSKEQLENLGKNFSEVFKDTIEDENTVLLAFDLILTKKKLDENKSLIETFIKEQKEWIAKINNLTPSHLDQTLQSLQLVLKDDEKKLETDFKAVNDQLMATYYTLPTRVQNAVTPIITRFKQGMFNLLAPEHHAQKLGFHIV